ncbi:MAG: phage holin [Chloroflexi bacterium]|nr:phage holin [Chloroflexota bacterium]
MDDILNTVSDAVIAGVLGIVPILVSIAFFYARSYLVILEEKVAVEIGETNWRRIEDIARTFIRAAEQKAGLDTGEAKKAFVKQLLLEVVEQLGLPLTDTQIDALIEGVLHELEDVVELVTEIEVETAAEAAG